MTVSQGGFQFGSGGIGNVTSAGFEKLDGVEDNKTATQGVRVTSTESGEHTILVNVEAENDPKEANSYKVAPGKSVFFPINRPDHVRVAGLGGGVTYTWAAY